MSQLTDEQEKKAYEVATACFDLMQATGDEATNRAAFRLLGQEIGVYKA